MNETNNFGAYPAARPRRNRAQSFSRRMVAENQLDPSQLIQPYFVIEGDTTRQAIKSMPDVERLGISELLKEAEQAYLLGIPAMVLFPVPEADIKSDGAEEAWNENGLAQRAIRALKKELPDFGVITDVALDPYTSHGQDGLMNSDGYIVNDETVEVLVKQSMSHIEAGADIVAPSDMMDGRVGAIRSSFENAGHVNAQILAYSAKFASTLYSPFREAVGSAATLDGADKFTYQIDPANSDEAMREIALDIGEGADMIMVKPGLPYLDIVRRARQQFGMPTFAYHVSGEYSMLKAAAREGWIDERAVTLELLLSFRRAGCDGVLTYCATQIARWLAESAGRYSS